VNPESSEDPFVIFINKQNLLQDSYERIMNEYSMDAYRSSDIKIHFVGEPGDGGDGSFRTWFSLLGKEIMERKNGLFEISHIDDGFCMISQNSIHLKDYLRYFRFVGRVIGLAVLRKKLLGISLPSILYKFILYRRCTMEDLKKFLDSQLYKNLFGLRSQREGYMGLSFSYDVEDADGKIITICLKEGGCDIEVDEDNVDEYIRRVVNLKIIDERENQMEEIRTGFYQIVDPEFARIFDGEELRGLVEGSATVDIDDWENHSIFQDFTSEEGARYKKWFWDALRSFPDGRKIGFLQFATGSSRVPLNGIAELFKQNEDGLFVIKKSELDPERLPTSHICVGIIDLPCYGSFEELSDKLARAIDESKERAS
jgi:E3 ubiquitin-protein ligase NEDD4